MSAPTPAGAEYDDDTEPQWYALAIEAWDTNAPAVVRIGPHRVVALPDVVLAGADVVALGATWQLVRRSDERWVRFYRLPDVAAKR
jgi:hypothetical protein